MLPSAWQQRQAAAPLQQVQQIRACPGLSSSRSSLQGLKLAFKQPAVQQVQRCSSSVRQQHVQAQCCSSVGTAAASVCSCAGIHSSIGSFCRSRHCSSSCSSQATALPQQPQQLQSFRSRQQRSAQVVRAASQAPPDPWQQPPGSGGAGTSDWGSSGSSSRGPPGGVPPPPLPPNGNGRQSPTGSYDAWDAAAPRGPTNGMPRYEQTDWGWTGEQQRQELHGSISAYQWAASIGTLCRHLEVWFRLRFCNMRQGCTVCHNTPGCWWPVLPFSA
jgi:hypothetical protein